MSEESGEKQSAEKPLTLKALQEILQAQAKEIEGLKAGVKKVEAAAPRSIRDGVATVTDETIEEFLKGPRPETEFWSLSPFTVICLQDAEREFDAETRRERVETPFFAQFQRWWGPGAELKKEDGTLEFANGIGYFDLGHFTRTAGPQTLDEKRLTARMVERVKARTGAERIYSGAEWREILRAKYALRTARKRIESDMNARIAAREAGAVEGDPKAGR